MWCAGRAYRRPLPRAGLPLLALVVVVVLLGAGCGKRDDERRPPPAPKARVPAPTPSPAPPRPPRPPNGCEPGGRTACAGDQVVECLADGAAGDVVRTCDTTCKAGRCVDTCAVEDVELVYVVDTNHTLSSFDPRKLPGDPFRAVGTLTCDPSSSPFSMAVDRQGIAWVLYASGRLHRVSIVDATCWPGGAAPAGGAPTTFGMGFVSEVGKPTAEVLYAAGTDAAKTLGRIDIAQRPPRWAPIAPVGIPGRHNPELTGTADGKLFGYVPGADGSAVLELDRATGKVVGPRHDVPGARGDVGAYAFAHWGGVFYVFATAGSNTAVHAIDRKTGAYHLVRERLPHSIVGAGVSTCAPLLEQAP